MRRILTRAALGVAVVGLLVSPAWAGSKAPGKPAKTAPKKAPTFDLHGVRWHLGLDGAQPRGKAAERPIVWMRVLGDPKGNT